MHIEIERKFRLTPEQGQRAVAESDRPVSQQFHQGYLSLSPAVRVRLCVPAVDPPFGRLTIKGPGMRERAEFEYPIPADDARALLAMASAVLEKTRYEIHHEGHRWEVDCFFGSLTGLWLAEIELSHADETFVLPPWLGHEVTEDPRYANAALARAGVIPSNTP